MITHKFSIEKYTILELLEASNNSDNSSRLQIQISGVHPLPIQI